MELFLIVFIALTNPVVLWVILDTYPNAPAKKLKLWNHSFRNQKILPSPKISPILYWAVIKPPFGRIKPPADILGSWEVFFELLGGF